MVSRALVVLGCFTVAVAALLVCVKVHRAAAHPEPPFAVVEASRPEPASARVSPPGTLSVLVRDAATGGPVSGVAVRAVALFDPSCGRRRCASTTDARGEARLDDVPQGPVKVFVGRCVRSVVLETTASPVVLVDLTAEEAAPDPDAALDAPPVDDEVAAPPDSASVVGVVRDEHGRALEFVRVAARVPGARFDSVTTMTAGDGSFRLDGVPAGRVTLRAGMLAGAPVTAMRDVTTGEPAVWDPVLTCGRVLSGLVTGESGAPRAFATVRVARHDAREGWRAETLCDGRGRFAIPACPAGLLTVAVLVPGWHPGCPWTVEGVVAGGDLVTLRVPDAARPSGFVSGRLLRPDGDPSPRATTGVVRATCPSADPVLGTTDAGGAFRIGPLAPGDYVVMAHGAQGLLSRLATCAVAAGGDCDVGDLTLGRPGFLRVRIDGGGAGAASPRLAVLERVSRRSIATLQPVVGFAVCGPLPPGAYALEVGLGDAREIVLFEVADGETTDIELPERHGAEPEGSRKHERRER